MHCPLVANQKMRFVWRCYIPIVRKVTTRCHGSRKSIKTNCRGNTNLKTCVADWLAQCCSKAPLQITILSIDVIITTVWTLFWFQFKNYQKWQKIQQEANLKKFSFEPKEKRIFHLKVLQTLPCCNFLLAGAYFVTR